MINIYIQTAYKVKSIYNKLIQILTTFSDYNVHDPATVEQEVKARSNHKKKKLSAFNIQSLDGNLTSYYVLYEEGWSRDDIT